MLAGARPLLIGSTRKFLSSHLCMRMVHTRIAQLLSITPDANGTPVSIAGHVRTIRKQKRVAFASIQDGSTVTAAQVVLSPEQAASISTGSAVIIKGSWIASKGGKKQAYELQADTVLLQGDNDAATNPIQKKYHTAEFLRTLPHLRVRTAHDALLLRLRSEVIANITAYFHDRGFAQTHTPIITSSDCEGAGEVFTVDANMAHETSKEISEVTPEPRQEHFFGNPKYLTVSSQLHLEALAQSLGKVWTLSPTFRAERSDTTRHLSEFYMLEAEVAFTNDMDDVTNLVEDLIRHVARLLQQSKTGQELLSFSQMTNEKKESQDPAGALPDAGILSDRWNGLIKAPWPRMTFQAVCSHLRQAHERGDSQFQILPTDTTGLQTEHERYLADVVCRGPVFVTHYPKAVKPFYMAPSHGDPSSTTVACFDLLLPEVCEVVGGSLREHRFAPLEARMRADGLLSTDVASEHADANPSNLDWYLDLRRYGSVPHGGFGLGFDRLLAFLSGVGNVRDVVTFPRHYKRCLS